MGQAAGVRIPRLSEFPRLSGHPIHHLMTLTPP